MGMDIGKYSFHFVGLDRRGAIVLRQKWSNGKLVRKMLRRERLEQLWAERVFVGGPGCPYAVCKARDRVVDASR
jgi:hypothetical protein